MASAFGDTQRERTEELAATIDPDWFTSSDRTETAVHPGQLWVPPSIREGKPVIGYWRKACQR